MIPILFRNIISKNKNISSKIRNRNVGSHKPSSKIQITEDYSNLVRKITCQKTLPSRVEWTNLREELLSGNGRLNSVNIDGIIIGMCISNVRLDVGKSYIDYLRSRGIEPNFGTLGKLLRLYHTAADIDPDYVVNENEIIEL